MPLRLAYEHLGCEHLGKRPLLLGRERGRTGAAPQEPPPSALDQAVDQATAEGVLRRSAVLPVSAAGTPRVLAEADGGSLAGLLRAEAGVG
ncbi:hypothetical protein SAMN05216275_106172 [Streptosporangium canum]|uniref:Uncharacterized protein n=1 Tax=Streptosporangium canum TaxID=324952 RepID=A0A1I3NBA6_9ACTN|nr:hypothetical protein SAMN05216275_106172 [Streptosporangium canum]